MITESNVQRVIAAMQQTNGTIQVTLKLRDSDVAHAETLAAKLGTSKTRVMTELLSAALQDAIALMGES